MKNLAEAEGIIPNKHFAMMDNYNWTYGYHKDEQTAEDNIIVRPRDDVEILAEDCDKVELNGDKKIHYWQIGQTKEEPKTLVVAISDCMKSYESWKEFNQVFDDIYQKGNFSKLVLDLRGNGGGENFGISHIAAKTYGNRLNEICETSIRFSPLAVGFLQKHGMYKKARELNLMKESIADKLSHYTNKSEGA